MSVKQMVTASLKRVTTVPTAGKNTRTTFQAGSGEQAQPDAHSSCMHASRLVACIGFTCLVCGALDDWKRDAVISLDRRREGPLTIHHCSRLDTGPRRPIAKAASFCQKESGTTARCAGASQPASAGPHDTGGNAAPTRMYSVDGDRAMMSSPKPARALASVDVE